MVKFRIGWFSTGRDEAARELLKIVQRGIAEGKINAQIAYVFCNRERGEHKESDLFIDLVESYHLSLICFSSAKFMPLKRKLGLLLEKLGINFLIKRWRLNYDREVMRLLAPFNVDLCVLSGYMLIVGDEMCQKYKLINLHPAKPGGPKGTWQEVIWQLIEQKANETGVMIHLVTPDLDAGPPITYCQFSIRGKEFDPLWEETEKCSFREFKKQGERNPLFSLIRKHGVSRELPLIVQTIKVFAEGKIQIENGKVVNAKGEELREGYSLTREIDEIVRAVPN